MDSADRTKYLFKNVVKGIGDYGNCFGVPTVSGESISKAAIVITLLLMLWLWALLSIMKLQQRKHQE